MLSDVTTKDDKATYIQENLNQTWREVLYSLRGKLDGIARATMEANMVPFGLADDRLIFAFQKKNCFEDPATLALVAAAYQQLFGFTGEILSVPETGLPGVKARGQAAGPSSLPSSQGAEVVPAANPGARPGQSQGSAEAIRSTGPSRSPAQAWEACKDQLRAEMSRASFDAWLDPAKFLAFEDSIFVVGLEDPYAKQWLESRLASTLQRILSGLMAQPVRTRLVVLPSWPGETPVPEQSEVSPSPANNPPAAEQKLWMKEKTDSLLELVLRPNRVIGVPGYLLRWLPYLGGTGLSILTGLRQSFYRKYHKLAVADQEFEASAPEVANLAGVAKSTFWRVIDSPAMRWFIQRVPLKAGENQWFIDPQTNTAKRHVNKFCFVNTIPLTPGDADRLAQALVAAEGAAQPEAALRKLLTAEPREYLGPMHQPPPDHWTGRDPSLCTVEAIVMNVSGLSSQDMTPELRQLIEKLSLAILRPTTDVVLISQYFWNHWLPRLGHNPGWIVIAMRDRGFASASTGEVREQVFLRGGYQELADLLGIQRVKTVREWLPSGSRIRPQGTADKNRMSGDEEYQAWLQQVPAHSDPWINATRKDLGRFLRITGEGDPASKKDAGALRLWVREGSEPLIPEDALAYQRILQLVERFVRFSADEQAAFLDSLQLLGGNRTHAGDGPGGNETHPPYGAGGNRTDPPLDVGGNETHEGNRLDGIRTHLQERAGGNETDLAQAMAEIGRLISPGVLRFVDSESLKRYFQHLQPLSQTTITTPEIPENDLPDAGRAGAPEDGKEVVVEEIDSTWDIPNAWDAEKLLMIIGAPKIRDQLRKNEVTAAAIVSCLLYISSESGGKMGIGYLATRLCQDPRQGQGSAYLRLAELPPETLLNLITNSLHPYKSRTDDSGSQALWKRTMGSCPKEKLISLLEYLGFDPSGFER